VDKTVLRFDSHSGEYPHTGWVPRDNEFIRSILQNLLFKEQILAFAQASEINAREAGAWRSINGSARHHSSIGDDT
jgi:hypothetical protein